MVVSPISEQESFLFSASRDRLIKLWHIDYQKKHHRHIADLDSHTDWVNQVILIPEARNTLVSCSNDTTIKIWRMDDLKRVKQKPIKPFSTLYDHDDYVRCIDYSLASGKLFSCSDDGQTNLFDLHVEKLLQKYEIWDKEKKPFDQLTCSLDFYQSKSCPTAMACS